MPIRETIGAEVGNDPLRQWAPPVFGGVIAGVGSFLVLYAASWLLIGNRVEAQFGDTVPTPNGVAWYLYNAHFVGLESDAGFGPFATEETTNLLSLSVDVTTDVLFLLPPIVLVVAGALACLAITGAPSVNQRVVAGIALTTVYVMTFVGGAVLAGHHVEGLVFGIEDVSANVGPSLAQAFLAGFAYPLIFAILGSFVMGELRQ